LFRNWCSHTETQLFLYDVTSSYLQGDKNEFAKYGYNRDKKHGKKQIVIGLLCDADGIPVSVEVFPDNSWKDLNVTVEEGISNLSKVCGTDILLNGLFCCQKIPEPKGLVKELVDSANVKIPEVLPKMNVKVTTKKRLQKSRLNH
jgi:hypothetical protein